jgi:inorganic pyrophosphatase/exopolyphosphatase
MCTIVGYLFLTHRQPLPKPIAVLMLQAILSDTLNLRSITTTDADRSMVALLTSYGGIGKLTKHAPSAYGDMYDDEVIDLLAKKQFQAKTSWIVALGPYEMVRGDQKDFACGPWKFGISVLEVTDTTQVLKVAQDILSELRLLKKEKGLISTINETSESKGAMRLARKMELDFAFLFIVNVVEQKSILLISGGRELALAKAAFAEDDEINSDGQSVTLQAAFPGISAPGSTIQPEETAMLLPKGYVSRKAQFVPAFFKAIQDDFEYEEKGPVSKEAEEVDEVSELRAAQVQEQVSRSKNPKLRRPRANSFRANFMSGGALEIVISREGVCDDELVRANKLTSKERHGNLYDGEGRIIRTYEHE